MSDQPLTLDQPPVDPDDEAADDQPVPPSPAEAVLRAAALAYPEAYEDHPWGETVMKVRGKVFVFFGMGGPGVSMTVKLPDSRDFAVMQPWAEPTGYNLGRAGWVSARFEDGEDAPIDILLDWLRESYVAVAPKRLSATLHPR
jgi:predicted DNA-binding protein (MmcQ/YjbR family)